MQIGEPCFWTTLHGFTGDTLLILTISYRARFKQIVSIIQWRASILLSAAEYQIHTAEIKNDYQPNCLTGKKNRKKIQKIH